LFEQVEDNAQLDKTFIELLKLIFFDAHKIVYSAVKYEELDQLLDRLYLFSHY